MRPPRFIGAAEVVRSITNLGATRLFAAMPGLMPESADFGATLIGVIPDPGQAGRSAHRGVVILFDDEQAEVVCVADAGSIIDIRTACASAVATDALMRTDITRRGIFGCDAQARSHLDALPLARPLEWIGIWARDLDAASMLVAEVLNRIGIACAPVANPHELAEASDIICTGTSATRPILLGEGGRPGTHLNLVGTSYAGPCEIDPNLVATSRYFVDYRRSARAAAEFLIAREAGVVDDTHTRGEIGKVLNGVVTGRQSASEITTYKSLGHVVQDLAAERYAMARTAEYQGVAV
jgi:ornithine cyclodeaminase